jgi:phage terminase large subunit-like protein
MRLGGGKQHGRYWMVDSIVDFASVPNLAEI